MDPRSLIPAPDTIPVPWGWFDALLHVTFVAHILLMNAVVGGAAIALATHLRGSNTALAKDLSTKMPTALALTINLGVAPLLFLQVLYGNFVYTSSVIMAAWWLSVIILVMAAYYGLYIYDFRFDSSGARPLLVAAPLALLVFVGFLFSNNMTLMLDPVRWTAWFDNRAGSLLNLGDPMLLPRWLHFMVAALAVGGLAVALLGRAKGDQEYVRTGLYWFTRATLAQVVFGVWFLLSLPEPALRQFLGGNATSALLLAGALVLAAAALMSAFKGNVPGALLWTVLTVAGMALVRDRLRGILLSPYQDIRTLAVTAEYSPMILFLAVFLLAIPLVAWLVRQYLRSVKES
ncbi:hypothetical protein M7784_06265 [Desulfovibrio aminophilus]|nr:hypothetical protein [Desulfovibrio aminophilus]MCM0754848.1 hypothetical protein [Desulfovibrio aminophilus]